MIDLISMVCTGRPSHPWVGTRTAILRSVRCPFCNAPSEARS